MKKIVLLIGLLFISFSGFSQDNNSILGKWTFKDVDQKETLEAEEIKMVSEMFKDFSLEFKEKQVVLTMMGKSEPAQWSFSEKDNKIINTVSKTGKKADLIITKFEEKEMVIKVGKAGPFVMSKS